MKKLNTELFIEKAKKIYGDKYDYSKVEYKGSAKKVHIICPIHGDFWVIANNFLRGHGCSRCNNRKHLTTKEFIKLAKKVHGNKYDYSKTKFTKHGVKVCIICPKHGEFWQTPQNHLNGNGCPKCYGTPKKTTYEFIEQAKKIYGKKYDYSKAEYKGNKIKICIICPKHGEFWVTPNNFLRGSECPKCYGTPKKTTEDFIRLARIIHGNKYDYSKAQYDGLKKKILIICPKHGEFWQTAGSHLNGCGCPKCNRGVMLFRHKGTKIKIFDKKKFIDVCRANHKIKYDYSKVEYKGYKTKVCIICPIHGEFWQSPSYHAMGGNCPKCAGGYKLNTNDFINKAKQVHGNKYDYSKVKYVNYNTKVCIICPKHGEFWQTPQNHLFGAGCPTCPQSNMEGQLRIILQKNDINFCQEKTFEWLKMKKHLFLDFYLPDYKIGIECQGLQHFAPVNLFGGQKFYDMTIQRDIIKHELCEKHGIKLLYFSRTKTKYIYDVFYSYTKLLNFIKSYKLKH